MADVVTANRTPRDADGPSAVTERWAAAMTTASLDLYRDLRDAAVEATFFATYGPVALASGAAEDDASEVAERPGTAFVKDALAHIEEGDRTEGIVRTALLLIQAGTGQRRLSTMKQARELVGKDVGLTALPADVAREIIRQQSAIVDLEPQKALATLPKLLATREDRRFTLDILDRLESRIEATPKQTALLSEIRRLIAGDAATGSEARLTAARTDITVHRDAPARPRLRS
jgi:hypothetical protein